LPSITLKKDKKKIKKWEGDTEDSRTAANDVSAVVKVASSVPPEILLLLKKNSFERVNISIIL
jgi:hypothetical protein